MRLLDLEKHPEEGGWFRETWRSQETAPADVLVAHGAPRSVGTAIYYLLTPDTFSEMHRLPGDEVFHFYAGDAVDLLRLDPDGSSRIERLGNDLGAGERPQVVVPGGVWQGSALAEGGTHGFALLGTTMAPGFDFADYERGGFEELAAGWPERREHLLRLTRT